MQATHLGASGRGVQHSTRLDTTTVPFGQQSIFQKHNHTTSGLGLREAIREVVSTSRKIDERIMAACSDAGDTEAIAVVVHGRVTPQFDEVQVRFDI